MKRILLVFALLIGLKSFGQTIDTSFHYCVAAQIIPKVIDYNYPIIDTCTHVGIVSINRDFTTNKTNITYYFGSTTRNAKGGVYIINDVDTREAIEVLSIIGDYLKITFK